MGNSYGTQVLGVYADTLDLSADGCPEMKAAGVTIDWTVVAAVGSDVTLNDGLLIPSGAKYLRYGQVITEITGGEINSVTITGTPTGGTFTLSVGGQTTTAIAYNAAASAVQSALQALSTVGTGNATVTGSAGGPYTVTFATSLGDVTMTASGALLTGGSSPAAVVATTQAGGRTGMSGPYDPSATDGRQTLSRGQCYLIRKSVRENDFVSNHPMALEGGLVFLARIIQSGSNTHTLVDGPTKAELDAAFPRLQYVVDE